MLTRVIVGLLLASTAAAMAADAPICDDPKKILWKKNDARNTWFCALDPFTTHRLSLFSGACPTGWHEVALIPALQITGTPPIPVTACLLD